MILKMNPENVANWFFRLNGCTTIPNFVVHPDHGGESQRTDVDVLAVRFPHRQELFTSGRPMVDHEIFYESPSSTDIILAEVKHSMCRLNGPWTNADDKNLHRVLYAIGAFEAQAVPTVAKDLYDYGQYGDEQYRVMLVAIGMSLNRDILPGATQLLWDEVLAFIYDRFQGYRQQKVHHNQWDVTGRMLYRLVTSRGQTREGFVMEVKTRMQANIDSHGQRQSKRTKTQHDQDH